VSGAQCTAPSLLLLAHVAAALSALSGRRSTVEYPGYILLEDGDGLGYWAAGAVDGVWGGDHADRDLRWYAAGDTFALPDLPADTPAGAVADRLWVAIRAAEAAR
jgi:hypothetical protein